MGDFSRVLSKLETVPELDELEDLLLAEHPGCRLEVEETGEEGSWSSLLLTTLDGIEVAVLERKPVFDGSEGQDEVADLLEEMRGARPESARQWLEEFLGTVQTVFVFQHLQGSYYVEGSAALHALRQKLFERRESVLQADGEGFTNEEGYHILWQFTDSVSGPWNMAVLEDGAWRTFTMDLGDPDQRAAFWQGEVPPEAETGRRRG